MQPEDAARATAVAIEQLGGAFMLDGATYARGAELGFSGIDFYVLGRGGVLGDTHGDVVAAAFVFWNPSQVHTQWEAGRQVMAPDAAAAEWVALSGAYGEANLPDLDGLDRLVELAGKVLEQASPSGAPLFAGWRHQARPAGGTKAQAQYLLNGLRELRGALHGGAVLAAGLTGREAVAYRAAHMAPIFGWDPGSLPAPASVEDRWKAAEAGTDVAFGLALAALDDAERDAFVELVVAAHAGWQAAKAG